MTALLHCPFCGGAPTRRYVVQEYDADQDGPAGEVDVHYIIACDNCGFEVGGEYRSEAVETWNRRAGHPGIVAETSDDVAGAPVDRCASAADTAYQLRREQEAA